MILSCGESLIDFVPLHNSDGKISFSPHPGGSTYNVAIAISRLNVSCGFLGKISNDFFGDLLVADLKKNKVDTKFVIRTNDPTTLAFVSIVDGEEPKYAFYNNGSADGNLFVEDINRSFDDIECMHFGSYSIAIEPVGKTLFELIKRESQNKVISIDPNIRPTLISDMNNYKTRLEEMISYATIVKVSSADLFELYKSEDIETLANSWLKLGPKVVFVTRGGKGAYAATLKGSASIEGKKIKVKDTVGAGDTFQGALLAWLKNNEYLFKNKLADIKENDLEECLLFANKAASITCMREGCDPPFYNEL